MKKTLLMLALAALLVPALVLAHFQVIKPSLSVVTKKSDANIKLKIAFTHPFDEVYMDMAPPKQVGVMVNGKKKDLTGKITEVKKGDYRTYELSYKIAKPGDHVFYVEPAPYWEPSEGKYIIHYTKAVVHAFGLTEGWDELVGFKIEIKPMVRPYGLWVGNVFQGQVLHNGKPVPNAEVEVTYLNEYLALKPIAEGLMPQVIVADENGVFTYAMPKAGWWGFAALAEDDAKMKSPDGKEVPVEIGGLMWVKASDVK